MATDPGQGGRHGLLIRRNRATKELAYYRCYSSRPVPLPALVKVAGLRWPVKKNFHASKALAGLDEHQVRTWTSWHRWGYPHHARAGIPHHHRRHRTRHHRGRSRSPGPRSPGCSPL
jgi:SRSO17 transposase